MTGRPPAALEGDIGIKGFISKVFVHASMHGIAATLGDQLHAPACPRNRSVIYGSLYVHFADALWSGNGNISENMQRDVVGVHSVNPIAVPRHP